jgi:hypothetical protein
MNKIDNAYNFDWSAIVVDSYDTVENSTILIFNFNFSNDSLIQDIFAYSIGYIVWALKNLPENSSYNIIYDVRSLKFSQQKADSFAKKVESYFDNYLIKKSRLNISFKY